MTLLPSNEIGERLRAARVLAKLSARHLGELAGLSTGHISLIESGKRPNLEMRTVERLAHVLGVSLDWLVRGEGSIPSQRVIVAAVKRASAA